MILALRATLPGKLAGQVSPAGHGVRQRPSRWWPSPDDYHEALQKMATAEWHSLNSMILVLINEGVERRTGRPVRAVPRQESER
jgi:hypothetical protein